MVGALSRISLRSVERKLRQVGLAISVVGTSRAKLVQLVHLATPVFESLVGDRPEVKRVRDDLRIQLHNVRRSSIGAKPASKAVYALADAVRDVMKLTDKGMGNVPEAFDVPPMKVINVWGYTNDEVRVVLQKLRQVMVDVTDVGLRTRLLYGNIILDPRETKHGFVRYVRQDDSIIMDPKRWEERRIADVYEAFAERMWWWNFVTPQWETWLSSEAFADAFVTFFEGGKLDGDRLARLRATVGVFADGWLT